MRAVGIVAVLLATGALGIARAQNGEQDEAPSGWSPELQMRFREPGATAISPDGSTVAFAVREPVMDDTRSEYREQIWVAAADGSGARQFTWREQSSSSPAFSPDGRFLAFLSKRAGKGNGNDDEGPKTQVWVMPLDGGEGREVTAAENGVTAFAWSPQGDRIAYLMTDPPSEEKKAAKKEKRDVEVVDRSYEYGRLWVVPFTGTTGAVPDARQLTDEPIHVTDLDWSPDGGSIVVRHLPDPRTNTSMIAGDLSIVDVESGRRRALVDWPGDDAQPRWSPDGRWVAFVSDGGALERVGLGDVWLVSAAGGRPKALAKTPDRNAALVDWTPDGRDVLIAESWRTERGLFLLPVDGSAPRRLDGGGGVIGSPALAAGSGAIAFVREDSDTPEDVWVTPLENGAPTRLTDLHAEVERPPAGRTELLTWRSKDGLEIEGLLTYPVGWREGERVPLVLNIHGGPAGVYSQTFTGAPSIYMLQTFAERGYAVLRPNPRGSTGYGRDFRYANVRDWCFGDYEDVISGVDAVIERGVADPERLFVMGWSYGGYMTSCVVSRTDRFRAASMGAGLPNLISMVHTTDIPDYLVAHQGGMELWQDFESYWRHSPMSRLDRMVTPTQIVHGAEDLRVPFGQGQELYVALQRKGVPTEMVVYPRTPHGPREPKFLMDVTDRILDWFERFLPEAGSGATGAGR